MSAGYKVGYQSIIVPSNSSSCTQHAVDPPLTCNTSENKVHNLDLVEITQANQATADLVKELVKSEKLSDSTLVDHVARRIVSDINKHSEEHLRKYHRFTLQAGPADLGLSTSQFFNLISLLKDVSLLGHKLLDLCPQFNAKRSVSKTPSPNLSESRRSIQSDAGKSSLGKGAREDDATSEDLLAAMIESSSTDDFLVLSSSLDSISTKDMIVAAMVHIKSHECFTLSHDIQSVAMVLRRVKFMIINILAPKEQMELIARILTSVGRYNEMNYAFDLFRDKNQFEILLSKGVEKKPELRIALFNYVKKNPEFYALVTLNFSMFREIAESLEASANKRLDKIIASRRKAAKEKTVAKEIRPRSSSISGRTKEALNLSLIELIDASDCYAKAGCYKRSNHCERRSKLVALEIALMSSDEVYTNLLDLSQSELTDAIVNLSLFSEAHIVADAYEFHLAWRQALFKRAVVDGDVGYLNEYCKKYELTSALADELSTLYRQYAETCDQEKRSQISGSMRTVLAKLVDVELRCKLYTQLNFDDAKKELLQDAAVQAHLRDLRLA